MKNRILTIAILIIAVMIAISFFQYRAIKVLKSDNNRLGSNQTALLNSLDTFKTKSGHYAAMVDVLQLKVNELGERNAGLTKVAQELGVKLKRVQSYSGTATETNIGVTAPVIDSTLFYHGKRDIFKCIDYRDNWVKVQGCIFFSKFVGTIQSRDTIRQIVHRVPKQWWFFKWGTKAIRQEVVSSNPYTKITFTEYIELK